jgi:hypothetical protein
VFKNRVLKTIFGNKKEEVEERTRYKYVTSSSISYSSSSNNRVNKSRGLNGPDI